MSEEQEEYLKNKLLKEIETSAQKTREKLPYTNISIDIGPVSMEELFENWQGHYHFDSSMKEWDNIEPKGNEIW